MASPDRTTRRRLSRREFLITGAVATGYALAVRPVSAETIVTPSEGLVAGEVKIPVAGHEIPAYRALPAKGGPFAVVLVVHEIFGVHEYIRDVCRRLAKRGYLAVAPDLYARQGDVKGLASADEIISKVVSKVSDAQVFADLDAVVTWAESSKGDVARLAITGFCWGGRVTWLYAAQSNSRVKAGVAWYGRLVGDLNERTPRQPLDVAASLKVPVLGLYGEEDSGIPLYTIERMRKALAEGSSGSQIVVYPKAAHGFHADYRASYEKTAAEDGWKRLLEWLGRHGAA